MVGEILIVESSKHTESLFYFWKILNRERYPLISIYSVRKLFPRVLQYEDHLPTHGCFTKITAKFIHFVPRVLNGTNQFFWGLLLSYKDDCFVEYSLHSFDERPHPLSLLPLIRNAPLFSLLFYRQLKNITPMFSVQSRQHKKQFCRHCMRFTSAFASNYNIAAVSAFGCRFWLSFMAMFSKTEI